MEINVLFFGVMAEVTGTFARHYTGVSSFRDLQMRLGDDFPGIENYCFRIIHNQVLAENDPILSDGDELGLLPPFYGG